MRMIFGLVLVVGIALAGAAVFLAKNFISAQQSAAQREQALMAETGGLTKVFVLNKAKSYGDTLSKDDVQLVYWQNNALPEGTFADEAVLFPQDAKAERFITRDIQAFEPILAVTVTEPGVPPGLTGNLDKGMRAFAIRVDAADFLQPSDRVDIYWTGNTSGTEGDITRLIESGMKVIAVDRKDKQAASEGNITSRTMTVAATPEQVARLAQAQATGRLVMSLVGIGDSSENGLVEVDGKKLLGMADAAPAPAPVQEKVCTIRTRKGADVVDMPIPCTN